LTPNDTIFALATAPGRAAVAVVRLSGPGAPEAVRALAGDLPAPRRASLRGLTDASGDPIDQALVLWFPGPASYTGEDSAELHLHGGRAVVETVAEVLQALGLRPAEAGEFSRRAFQNGKLDLTQAEAVADLVDAETAAQRRQALDQLGGALGRRYEDWRSRLIEALALLEAEIDFPDEDVPGGLSDRVRPSVEGLLREIGRALDDAARGERVRDGYRIAIVGAPNAGKSSLFNALVRREAAIVTAIPGTTRDVLEANFQLGGYKVLLADTAGVRVTDEAIEAEGVRRAQAWAGDAALRLWVVDGSAGEGAWREAAALVRAGDLLLLNKSDLGEGADGREAADHAASLGAGVLAISSSGGAGLPELESRLAGIVADALSGAEFPAVTRARHQARLAEAREHLSRALTGLGLGPELAAEDLRLAARALARVAGRIDAEDILDVVFASFCIGK
jgi:tRNA modification GTPase